MEIPTSLISLINAKKDLSKSTFDIYLKNRGIHIKDSELLDLNSLIEKINEQDVFAVRHGIIFNNFYVGYTIKQIGKEFDLLRLGDNYTINIELKRESTGQRILEQLIKNKYYLKSLEKEVYNFTYVVNEEKLYFLNKDESLSEVDVLFLIEKLNDQDIKNVGDINDLFDPTNYLVSPFNSTDRFMNNEYFLTNHQKAIREEIIKMKAIRGASNFISIQGSAGTGKTLLIYDIAKEYINDNKKVLLIHCGRLNPGHLKLINDYHWDIVPVKEYKKVFLTKCDLVIIDETQRIYPKQLDEIIQYLTETQTRCIFSYDPLQCLHDDEVNNNIPVHIEKTLPEKHKLSEKIRTNKELTSFIKNLFDLSKRNDSQIYSNIDIQYFSSSETAKSYIYELISKGWTTIDYTLSQYNSSSLNKIVFRATNYNAHSVIGQEFDNVVAVIGDTFYYNSKGKLAGPNESYYHPTNMLFQILTRTRKKLSIIIINNEKVLNECLKILM